jgi:AbiV family abortive infection protein
MNNTQDVFEDAYRKSLANAKQLLRDAKLLIHESSFGHAIALAISADEEIAKAISCWLVAKRLVPEDSKVVDHAFSRHDIKHMTQIVYYGRMQLEEEFRRGKLSLIDILKEGMRLTEKQLEKDIEKLYQLAMEREYLRQDGLYVNLTDDGTVSSPSQFTLTEAKDVVSGVEQRLAYQERLITMPKPEELASIKAFIDSVPKEAIEEGEIPIDWFTLGKKRKSHFSQK